MSAAVSSAVCVILKIADYLIVTDIFVLNADSNPNKNYNSSEYQKKKDVSMILTSTYWKTTYLNIFLLATLIIT